MSDLDPTRYFGLKKPCAHCPFRADRVFPLHHERRVEIAADLMRGEEFVCHKTITYLDDDSDDEDADTTHTATDQTHARSCAGARETARRSGITSQPEQIARRLGCDVPDVDTASPVYDNLAQWIDHAPD